MSVDGRRGRRARGALKAELVALLTRAPEPLSARDLRAAFPGSPVPTATSLLTVLERLRVGGTVDRAPGPDGELHFWLVRTEPPRTADAMLEELLRSDDRSGALQQFAGRLGHDDVAVLRRVLDGAADAQDADQGAVR